MALPFSVAFVRETPVGVLAGVTVPGVASPDLQVGQHPEERAYAAGLNARRQREWVAGRMAFWAAAAELGQPRGSLLRGSRGEPLHPPGLTGSISHKKELAVALVARANGGSVGVDLEALAPARPVIERIALRADERATLSRLPESARWASLVVSFSVKEALYKALHPRLRRHVRYEEAAVTTLPAPRIALHLDEGPHHFATEVHLEPLDGHVLSCVRVLPLA